MSWIDQLSNAKAVWGILPNGDVPLTDLLLLELKYAPGNRLTVALASTVLPSQMPARWQERGVQEIELRFGLGTIELAFNVPSELDEAPMLSVSLIDGVFEVRSQASPDAIWLKTRVFSASLVVQPLGSQVL